MVDAMLSPKGLTGFADLVAVSLQGFIVLRLTGWLYGLCRICSYLGFI